MIIDCAITNHTCPQLLNIQRGSSNMWNIQLSLHSTQLLPFHKPLPSGIMAAILNHHCQFLTQLNCHPFTTPLSWQQYSTTYCQFFTQLNCHSFTNHSPLVSWQQYSTTIADFSLNSTVIHSPLPYHGSNILPIFHSTQLPTHSLLVIWQQLYSATMADFSLPVFCTLSHQTRHWYCSAYHCQP